MLMMDGWMMAPVTARILLNAGYLPYDNIAKILILLQKRLADILAALSDLSRVPLLGGIWTCTY